jgi:hypothetical protein
MLLPLLLLLQQQAGELAALHACSVIRVCCGNIQAQHCC